jgi:superfamily II DNA or RNA helicase
MADVEVTLHSMTRSKVVDFFASAHDTTCGAMYTIPDPPGRAVIEKSLTLDLPSYHGSTETYPMFEGDEERLHVPRFYGLHQYGTPTCDLRVDGAPVDDAGEPTTDLRPWQAQALPHIVSCLNHHPWYGGIVQAGCGLGKTCLAIQVARAVRVRTAVLVHRSTILEQWAKAFARFAPSWTVSRVQGACRSSPEAPPDVMIVMIQTLVSGRVPPDPFGQVGLVIVDECHHLCARTFQKAMRYFPAKRIMGLSATLERSDGNHKGVMWLLGDPIAVARRQTTGGLLVRMPVLRSRGSERLRSYASMKPQLAYTYQLRDLGKCGDRLAQIVTLIMEEYDSGRMILVIAGRKDFLGLLKTALEESLSEFEDPDLPDKPPDPICLYVAETSKKRIAERTDLLHRSRLILTTTAMASEGFDHPLIDTVVLTNPIGTKSGVLEQAVGRCQRTHPEKRFSSQVIDIVDDHTAFRARSYPRAQWYRSQGFQVVDS